MGCIYKTISISIVTPQKKIGSYATSWINKLLPKEVLTERGWVQAVNVTLNDSLYNAQSNSYIPVTSNIELTGNYVMYNYQISGESQSCIVGGYAIQFQIYQPNG